MANTSMITKAIEGAKSSTIKVESIEVPKPKKIKGHLPIIDHYKPSIYIDDRELATISGYKAGDKVVITCECTIKSVGYDDRVDSSGKSKKTYRAEISIDAMADITPSGTGKGGK